MRATRARGLGERARRRTPSAGGSAPPAKQHDRARRGRRRRAPRAGGSTLPTLLAIFSPPSCSIPLCIQICASSAPRAHPRLRGLVLVMGEDEVVAAAVDLEADAEQLLGHRRALDVPARPAAAPRRVPGGVLALLLRLPQREVERILLAVGALDALALVHLVDGAVAQRAVVGVGAHAEVDVAVDRVGVAALDRAPRSGRRSPSIVSDASGSGSGRPSPSALGVGDVVRGHLRARAARWARPSGRAAS